MPDSQPPILSYHTPPSHAGVRRIWRMILSILLVLVFIVVGGIAGGAAANYLFGSYYATMFLLIQVEPSSNSTTLQSTVDTAVARLNSPGFFSQAYIDLDATTARH